MADPTELPDSNSKQPSRLHREMIRALVNAGVTETNLSVAAEEVPARADLFERLQRDLCLLIDNLRLDFRAASSDYRLFNRLLDGQETLQAMSETLVALRSELGDKLFR